MLDFLPSPVKGVLVVLLILLNTLVLFPFLLLLGVIKLVIPVTAIRKLCSAILNGIAHYWIGFNNVLMKLFHKVEWDVRGVEGLSRNQWYFVTCNHQSWADIPAIQYVLNSEIPVLKFFLKKQLDRKSVV